MANGFENKELGWRAVKTVNDFRIKYNVGITSLVQLQFISQDDLCSIESDDNDNDEDDNNHDNNS
jgi:hypothetical protein